MVRIWAGTVLAVAATLACGVAGDVGRRGDGGTSDHFFHEGDEVGTLHSICINQFKLPRMPVVTPASHRQDSPMPAKNENRVFLRT